MSRFQNQIHGYAIVEAQFETIISFKPSVKEHVDLEELFNVLDNDHDGRIDGLEFLGGLALCCNASFEDKARFCFELFDFNLNSLLSQKELAMMMLSSICGMNILIGGSEDLEPSIEEIDKIAEEALNRADKNGDGQVSYEEFVFWARSNRDLMAGLETLNRISAIAKEEVQSDDSAPETEADDNSVFEETSMDDHVAKFTDDNRILKTNVAAKQPRKDTSVHAGHPIMSAMIESPMPSSGDQALAIVPWLGQLQEPTNYKKRRGDDDGPATNLTLLWAFGVRAKFPNFARYLVHSDTGNKLIVYTTAALCIIFDCSLKVQNFYLGHTVEITAMTVHPNNQIVATADRDSMIHIWTLDKAKKPVSLLAIKSLVKGGIQNLAFSPTGDRIAAVGMDNDHTLCLYNTSKGELISSSKGMTSPNDVFDIAYCPSGTELVLAGRNSIKFFLGVNTNVRAINSKIGRIGSKGKRQVFCSAAYIGNEAVIGCASGEIYRFKDCECIAIIQAHGIKEPVLCMYFNPVTGNLITGSKDANIKTWDANLKEVGVPLDLSEDVDGDGIADSGSLNPSVLSVHQIGDTILIGTNGCDIFEATLPSTPTMHHTLDRIARGHSFGELWGLAVHPTRDEFVTVGEDKTVRLWSIRSKEQTNIRSMPEAARAVAYAPSGGVVCIGLVDGTVSLMDPNTQNLRVYQSWKHSSKMVNDIKFSNDGSLLAIASADTNIYLYKSDDKVNFRRQAVCRGHSGAVTHLDFSANSQYLQSNGTDYSILYWDMTGNQIKQTSAMRDVLWATFTCVLGWPVQGIWAKNCDYTDINACMAVADVGDIVTGDDFGKVNLFRYPALKRDAIHQSYVGHASHVTNVRFTWNRRHLVSTGGKDRSILLWVHDMERNESDHEADANSSSAASSADSATESRKAAVASRGAHPVVNPRSIQQEAANLGWTLQDMKDFVHQKKRTVKLPTVGNNALLSGPSRGDESGAPGDDGDESAMVVTNAVAPWKACVIEPTHWTPCNQATDVDLTLLWVHGHRSKDCRNNVFYSAEGSIVYNAANLAVVYHKPSGKQLFLNGPHIDEIISIAIHPAGQIFATGEAGRKSNVIIWNSTNMNVVGRLEGIHDLGTSLLAFSSSGDTLASIGMDDLNTLCIHNWQKNIQILRTPTSKNKILAACFLQCRQNLELAALAGEEDVSGAHGGAGGSATGPAADQDILVTGGYRFLKFWWWQGQNVQSQSAIWAGHKKERKSIILSIASGSSGVCVTGASNGSLLLWKDFKIACNVRRYFQSMEAYMQSRTEEGPAITEVYPIAPEELVFYPKGGYPHKEASIMALCVVPGSIDYASDAHRLLDGYEQSCRYISADHDGTICVWRMMRTASDDHRLLLAKTCHVSQFEQQLSGFTVKSIYYRDGLIVVGNNASEIIELSDDSLPFVNYFFEQDTAHEPVVRSRLLGSGHGSGEIWGLAVHPELPVFFTTGDDATVRCWHLQTHELLSYAYLGDKSRAVDIRCQDSTEEIAIGLNDGSLVIVDLKAFLNPTDKARTSIDPDLSAYNATDELGLIEDSSDLRKEDEDYDAAYEGSDDEKDAKGDATVTKPAVGSKAKSSAPAVGRFVVDWIVESDRKPAEWVEILKYSMEGSVLACGSHDHVVYVYDVRAQHRREHPVTKKKCCPLLFKFADHRGHVTHLDFGVFVKIHEHIDTKTTEEDAIVPASNRLPTPTAALVAGGGAKVVAGDKLRKTVERYVTEQYDPAKVKVTVLTTDVVTLVNQRTGEVVARDSFTSAPPQVSSTIAANAKRGGATGAASVASTPAAIIGGGAAPLANKHQVPDALVRDVALSDLCVQSCSSVGELCFWKLAPAASSSSTATGAGAAANATSNSDVPRAERLTSMNAIKDVFWHTYTVPYGWPVQGMWTEDLQVSDLLAVDRSHSFEKVPVIAASDAIGRIKIYSYPCVLPNAPDKCYRGHTNKVTNLRFSHDDNFVITTGGPDQCVFIAADRPWKQLTYPEPTNAHELAPNELHGEPEMSLDLKYVYGYRGWDCRNNLMFADSRHEVVYHIAGVGIVLNTQTNTQILNTEHNADILCLAVHPEGHTVATGEVGKFPRIVLWDANTGITIRTFQGHKKGVAALAFSSDGHMLVSVGLDADHTILVHHTQTGAILGRGKCGRHPITVYCLAVSQSGTIATGGKDFIKFWNLPSLSSSGGELSSKTGIFSLKTVKSQTAVSCAFLGLDCVTGMADGTLCLWKDRSNTKAIPQAHQGAITAMTAVFSITAVSGGGGGGSGGSAGGSGGGGGGSGGGGGDAVGSDGAQSQRVPRFLLTGGQDGMIHLRDIQFNLLWSLNMKETTPLSLQPSIQALASRDGKVLIGTKAAEIYEVSLTGSLDTSRGEVWGLGVHPKLHYLVTCADDQTVRLWDYKNRRPVNIIHTMMACRAVDFHPDGSQIAVTHNDGHLQVLSSDLSTEMAKITVSSSWSPCVAYSPDGHLLAIGCRGDDADAAVVCLYETKSWSCRAKCRGHANAVTHVDFSADGQYLRSASTSSAIAYELLYWSTRDGKQVTSSSVIRDVYWATSHCVLGWETQGLWAGVPAVSSAVQHPHATSLLSGQTDVIVTSTRSPDDAHLVAGGDGHLLKVFKAPAYDDHFQYKAYKGHVDSIKRVRFSADGKTLFSVGGLDKAILQFEVKTKK
eukprot:gene7987-5748_t